MTANLPSPESSTGPSDVLGEHLGALVASGLIRPAGGAPAQMAADWEYLFRHALVQETAYQSMLKADRRALHLAAGEALERLYGDRVREVAAVLAQHFLAAEAGGRAAKYLLISADGALAVYANREAEQYLRAALPLTEAGIDRANLLARLGEALFRQDRFEPALDVYQQSGEPDGVARMATRSARVVGTAHAGDPQRSLALCRAGMAALAGQPETAALAALVHETARACYFNGLLDEARRLGEQALAMAERLGDVETQAEALATLWGLLPTTSPEAAVAGLRRGAHLAESAGLLYAAARAHHNLGFRLGLVQGDLSAGHEHAQRAAALFHRVGSASGEFYALDNIIILSALLGDLAAVEATLAKSRELLGSVGNPEFDAISVRLWEAWLLASRGDVAASIGRFRPELETLRRLAQFDMLGNFSCHLAEMLREMGEWEAAEAALREAVDIADRGFMPGVEARCLLGAVLAHQGRLDEALRRLGEAREEARQYPSLLDEALLTLTEARLARIHGRRAEALAAFETAAGLYDRIGARGYRAQTLVEWAEAQAARNAPEDVEQARALLQAAQALYEAMDRPYYAALVRDRLKSLVPTDQ
jgi:tetratricopeptide (TPR) repeat protein